MQVEIEDVEVEPVPEPEQPDEGVIDPDDAHREGVDAVLCKCTHGPREHADGHCGGVDSYGVGCECPSYVEMGDGDDDEA